MSQQRVVLAFSGGLDTSYCLVYLIDHGYEVLTVNVDTGGLQPGEADEIRARAEELGAAKHIVIDAREPLYDRYISYIVKSNYLRNGVYPSCVGVERCIQAEEVVNLAVGEGAQAIAHGSTAAGGDHVRFDVVAATIAPDLEIITPVRDNQIKREVSTKYLRDKGFHVEEKTSKYSINAGLVGTTIGGGETYSSWEYLPEDAWTITRAVDDAPAGGVELTIAFESGLPVGFESSDGQEVIGPKSYSVLEALNALGATHGIGRGIHTGFTIMGNPARIGFEAPGILTINAAHRELERAVLTPRQQNAKAPLATVYGDMLHEGIYYDPLMRDLEAMFDSSQRRVTGDVRLRLHKGGITLLGVRSDFSLLEAARKRGAVYGHSSSEWSGADARGFAHIYSVAGKVARAASNEDVK